jgi:NAD(P)-dependent dehydrogenase (short-subunit alcohol dehydrogenase family)
MAEAIRADLSGKTCLVTGASAGIGKATALALARLGAHVILAVRNLEKGEAARIEIERRTGSCELELARVDLASQRSIRVFAGELSSRHPRLDVLVNNAGVWRTRRELGPDGVELTWATNVIGYFLASELLLPLLVRAGSARIVNVASELAYGLDLDDVQYERRRYRGRDAYAQSKQADRMLTWALARRLAGSGVTANALHPGFVATEIFGKGGGVLGLAASLYSKLGARTPEEGADTAVYLAASPEVEGRSGEFWVERRSRPCRFRDERAEEALLRLCRTMTAGSAGATLLD